MFQKFKNNTAAFPLVTIFFVFLFGFSLLDIVWPKRDTSELENRSLQQLEAPTAKTLLSNKWMENYADYVKDQFALRDNWIDLKSRSEYLLAKTENNNVLLGKNHYLFKKYYAVNDSRLADNLQLVADFGARHAGQVSVMIVPSASLVLEENLPYAVPLPDENRYFDQIISTLQGSTAVYDLRTLFSEHKDEYIFYRTDHHWTTGGAYLAYTAFANANGLTPFDTATHTAVDVENFYGTNYSSARNWNVVPDTLTYYDVNSTLSLISEDAAGIENNGAVYNTEKLATRDKYAAFLYGNNGYSVLNGSGSGNILVIKDSYANCFIPFLSENYAKIGILDLRNYSAGVDELMESEGYDKVLFLYNFQSFFDDRYISRIRR